MRDKLYRVEWNGGVMVYVRTEGDWFLMETVTASNEFEDFRLVDEEPTRETIRRVAKSELSEGFLDKELAKPVVDRKFFLESERDVMLEEAKRRWDFFIAPNERYKVVRTWDSVPDGTMRTGLTKREARALADKWNKAAGIYTRFHIKQEKD